MRFRRGNFSHALLPVSGAELRDQLTEVPDERSGGAGGQTNAMCL